jgi:TatD DNase family protein
MIDTHAHLHAKAYDWDRPATLARAFDAGVEPLLEVNIDAGGFPHALALAESDPRVYLTVGIHPHDTGRAQPRDLDRLFRRLDHPRVRAVGETGIDYYRNYAPHDLQQEFFRRHVTAARETGLPLVVHARQGPHGPSAHDDIFRILKEEGHGKVTGVLHCFSGAMDEARRAAVLGFALGIGGAITYNPKRSFPLLSAIAAELGTGMFVLETDCPYLTPHPRRNERNEPANIPVIARALADALAMPPEAIERQTDANAMRIFRLRDRPAGA